MSDSPFQDKTLILFQGDSITDCERVRGDPASLGQGYVMLLAAWLQALYPTQGLTCLNRGVSGDRVSNLAKRWQTDCLGLQPDWLSILVGVNDVWTHPDGSFTTDADFEATYRGLLNEVKTELPATRLIICEPFILPPVGKDEDWHSQFDPKLAIVRRLAREFKAIHVPLADKFDEVAKGRPGSFWIPDGIHPSLPGHALIAQTWLKALD